MRENLRGYVAGENMLSVVDVAREPPEPADRNPAYAARLRALLAKLDMPREYIDSIR